MNTYTDHAVSFAEDHFPRKSALVQGAYKTAEQELREQVESNGHIFLKINWKKRTIHFLDEKGNKQVQIFNPRS